MPLDTSVQSMTSPDALAMLSGLPFFGANRSQQGHLIDTVAHASLYSSLYAAHQRHRAVLPLVHEEERPVRTPTDQVTTSVLLDNPVLSHVDIIT